MEDTNSQLVHLTSYRLKKGDLLLHIGFGLPRASETNFRTTTIHLPKKALTNHVLHNRAVLQERRTLEADYIHFPAPPVDFHKCGRKCSKAWRTNRNIESKTDCSAGTELVTSQTALGRDWVSAGDRVALSQRPLSRARTHHFATRNADWPSTFLFLAAANTSL